MRGGKIVNSKFFAVLFFILFLVSGSAIDGGSWISFVACIISFVLFCFFYVLAQKGENHE